jgi:hypothetical protein
LAEQLELSYSSQNKKLLPSFFDNVQSYQTERQMQQSSMIKVVVIEYIKNAKTLWHGCVRTQGC